MLVRKNQYGRWSTPCSSKDMGGNEMCVWMSVQFNKGNEPKTETAMIEVNKMFMSCFNSKEGIKPKMVIMDWAYAEKVVKKDGKKEVTFDDSTLDVKPDDLPFY